MTGATCCPSKLHSESLSLLGGPQLTSQILSQNQVTWICLTLRTWLSTAVLLSLRPSPPWPHQPSGLLSQQQGQTSNFQGNTLSKQETHSGNLSPVCASLDRRMQAKGMLFASAGAILLPRNIRVQQINLQNC